VPDINLGAIVAGDPPKIAVVDTTKGSNRYHPTCAGTSTGKDIVVHFTVKDTVSILLEMTQSTGEHFYGLYSMPKAGDACDSDQDINCPRDPLTTYTTTNWSYFTPGEYLFIFKASAAGNEGQITVTVSAWANRGVELCDNGIDDDGNGLVDCADPACATASNCQAPMCLPDSDLGDLDIGTSKTLNVDLTNATRTFSTVCGHGTGYGRIYRLNILQPMALSVRSTQNWRSSHTDCPPGQPAGRVRRLSQRRQLRTSSKTPPSTAISPSPTYSQAHTTWWCRPSKVEAKAR